MLCVIVTATAIGCFMCLQQITWGEKWKLPRILKKVGIKIGKITMQSLKILKMQIQIWKYCPTKCSMCGMGTIGWRLSIFTLIECIKMRRINTFCQNALKGTNNVVQLLTTMFDLNKWVWWPFLVKCLGLFLFIYQTISCTNYVCHGIFS